MWDASARIPHCWGLRVVENNRSGYCIFIDTLCEGAVPLVRDENGLPFVFASRIEAEREIADDLITRLQQFIDGEREFEDAMTAEEYVVEVDVLSDGSVIDSDDNHFGPRAS